MPYTACKCACTNRFALIPTETAVPDMRTTI